MAFKSTGGIDTSKLPQIPAAKPPLKFGYLADVGRLPVIKNFSFILHWMYNNWPSSNGSGSMAATYDMNDPQYFGEEDLTISRQMDGSSLVDAVLADYNAGKSVFIKCGAFKYSVNGICDDASGIKGFCCSGAYLVGSELKIHAVSIIYNPTLTKTVTSYKIV